MIQNTNDTLYRCNDKGFEYQLLSLLSSSSCSSKKCCSIACNSNNFDSTHVLLDNIHLVLLRLFRVFTISKTPRIHLGIAALSSIKRPFPFHLYCQILLSVPHSTGSKTKLCTMVAFHDVILKASESLLILDVSSEQTLFWALSMALSPMVWLRNLCHSSIWVGSYLDANI